MYKQISLPIKSTPNQRRVLKFRLASQRRTWGKDGLGLYCPICGELITGAPDMHEVLITRGDFPKEKQYLIWDACNCTLVHQDCHRYAATKENQQRLILSLVYHEGLDNIKLWLYMVEQYTKGNQVADAIRLLEECVK